MIDHGTVFIRGRDASRRIAVIDYFKALCIIFVIINHSDLLDQTMPLFLLTINSAVPIFMILSGYVYSIGANIKTLKEQYSFRLLKKRFIRFTVPMLITFVLYIALRFIGGGITIDDIVTSFVFGQYGAGSYYYHLMIQFIIIAPLIYTLLSKFDANGVVLLGLVNFIFEILSSAYNLHPSLYRIIILRYTFAITLGMYAGMKREKKISTALLGTMLIFGTTYIIAPYAWGYSYRIFTFSPQNITSMFFVFYIFPIVYIILDHCNEYRSKTFLGKATERIGRASYHIMYTQMILFMVKPGFDKMVFDTRKYGAIGELVFELTVSIVTGLIFEFVMNMIQTTINNSRMKHRV